MLFMLFSAHSIFDIVVTVSNANQFVFESKDLKLNAL